MTTLRNASLLSTSVALTLTLTACPGDTSGGDAGQPAVDAFTVELDAPSTDDAYATDGSPFLTFDAFSADDAFAPSTDDAGPIVGDSFVSRTCGPADGPALTLTISDFLDATTCSADGERASTYFFIHDLGGATIPPTSGATITSSTAESNGTATHCPGGSPPCRLSETWSVTFTTYADDGGASGQYVIMWEGGETSTGTFQATRCTSGPVICG